MKTESMSTRRRRRVGLTKKKGRSLQRAVLLHQQLCQKKRLVCWKFDEQSFVEFAHHLPLGSVNVW